MEARSKMTSVEHRERTKRLRTRRVRARDSTLSSERLSSRREGWADPRARARARANVRREREPASAHMFSYLAGTRKGCPRENGGIDSGIRVSMTNVENCRGRWINR